jgi:hypothetical protein
MSSIAFTGNRDYADRASLYRGLDKVKADRYYFGGARGADTDALEYITKTQPASERIVVVPDRVIDQPVAVQPIIKAHATGVVELGNSGPDRYQIRNRHMVDQADRVVAFTDGRKSGGTYNTVQYAHSQGKSVEVIEWYDFDKNVIYAKNEAELVEWIEQCRTQEIPKLTIKGMVIGAMKKFPKSSWPKILEALNILR